MRALKIVKVFDHKCGTHASGVLLTSLPGLARRRRAYLRTAPFRHQHLSPVR
jgi:hypothetical protein